MGDDGTHSATPLQRSRPLDEILEPVRREFEESGMTEEELTRFLSQVRDEVRQEKRARKDPFRESANQVPTKSDGSTSK